jgi:hypothetical protein
MRALDIGRKIGVRSLMMDNLIRIVCVQVCGFWFRVKVEKKEDCWMSQYLYPYFTIVLQTEHSP